MALPSCGPLRPWPLTSSHGPEPCRPNRSAIHFLSRRCPRDLPAKRRPPSAPLRREALGAGFRHRRGSKQRSANTLAIPLALALFAEVAEMQCALRFGLLASTLRLGGLRSLLSLPFLWSGCPRLSHGWPGAHLFAPALALLCAGACKRSFVLALCVAASSRSPGIRPRSGCSAVDPPSCVALGGNSVISRSGRHDALLLVRAPRPTRPRACVGRRSRWRQRLFGCMSLGVEVRSGVQDRSLARPLVQAWTAVLLWSRASFRRTATTRGRLTG